MEIPEPDHQLKVPVVCRPSYCIALEQATRKHTFIHCDVYRWTPRVFRELQRDFARLREMHGGPIYALHRSDDSKHLKFLKLFGFQCVATFVDGWGTKQQIFEK